MKPIKRLNAILKTHFRHIVGGLRVVYYIYKNAHNQKDELYYGLLVFIVLAFYERNIMLLYLLTFEKMRKKHLHFTHTFKML